MKFDKKILFILGLVMLLFLIPSPAFANEDGGGDDEFSLFTSFTEQDPDEHLEMLREKDLTPGGPADLALSTARVELNEAVTSAQNINPGDIITIDLFEGEPLQATIEHVKAASPHIAIRGTINDTIYSYFIIITYDNKSLIVVELPEKNRQYQVVYNHDTSEYYNYEIALDSYHHLKRKGLSVPEESSPEESPEQQATGETTTEDRLTGIQETTSLNIPYLNSYEQLGLNSNIVQSNARTTIDVMIVYTQAARNAAQAHTGIQHVIEMAMARSQQVLDNSNTLIDLRLVHSAEITYTEYTGAPIVFGDRFETNYGDEPYEDMGVDLVYITEGVEGFAPVHQWRDQHGADLVALLGDYPVDKVVGMAWTFVERNLPNGIPNHAYSANSVNVVSQDYTLVHEMGHNMGAGHHKEQRTQPGPQLYDYSAGWRWVGNDNNRYCSVMTYPHGTEFADGLAHEVVPYFSDPDIRHEGVPTGHVTHGNNALTLRQTRNITAAYRESATDPGPEPDPDNELSRLFGPGRYETAVEMSREGWPDGSNTVVIATGENYPDALAGAPLAGVLEAPILLTRTGSLPAITQTEVQRLRANRVILLGGDAAINPSVENTLSGMVQTVDRYGGTNRFDTARLIAREMDNYVNFDWAFIADGFDFPDALSAASFAARERVPVLLTRSDRLPQETRNAFAETGITRTIVVGGTNAVSNDVFGDLPSPERIFGSNRVETSMKMAERFLPAGTKQLYIATARAYPDALAGSSLATKNDSGILLVDGREDRLLTEEVQRYLVNSNFTKVTLLGGPNAINIDIEADTEYIVTGIRPHVVKAKASPEDGGRVTGSGCYHQGESVTLTATPDSEYEFKNWTEGGDVFSNNTTYTFPAYSDRNLVANFEEIIKTPPAPELIEPANNAIVTADSVQLKWQAISGVENYQIYIYDVTNNQVRVDESIGDWTHFTIRLLPKDGTIIEWRVRAENEHGWGPWSETRTLISASSEKDEAPPPAPKLLYPTNNSILYTSQTMLDWEPVSGATNYQSELTIVGSTWYDLYEGYIYRTYINLPRDGTTYKWRVRAANEHGWGPWSDTVTFTSW